MSEIKSQFFNGKTYSAVDFVESNKNTMKDGILPNTEYFKVLPAGNMTIGVTSGRGWVQGHAFSSDSTLSFALDRADGVLDRVDTIVIRLDLTTDNEKIECKVIKGALGGSATAPVRNGTYYDLVIAYITVAHGTTAITTAMITDKRGDGNLCGWSGAISGDQFNFDELRQSKADINTVYNECVCMNSAEFLESGTWVCPEGVYRVAALIQNGGSGSPGASVCSVFESPYTYGTRISSSGRAGNVSLVHNIPVTPGESYPIIIGAGGAAGAKPTTYNYTTGYVIKPAGAGGMSSAFGYNGISAPGGASTFGGTGDYSVMYDVNMGDGSFTNPSTRAVEPYLSNDTASYGRSFNKYEYLTSFNFLTPLKKTGASGATYIVDNLVPERYRPPRMDAGYAGAAGKVKIYY